ncbi:tetratricopeptide repeat protein [Marimonas lutisalis]|uniref:tetratricopeptide repeat protein n=1 Tax=Marimonas lutisalis TaxID=2545756 RepID=UPI00137609B8|nr:SEL1-like repeat protein [Marimonas lutisalis]
MTKAESITTRVGRATHIRAALGAMLIASALSMGAAGYAQTAVDAVPAVEEANNALWSDPDAETVARARQVLEAAAAGGDSEARYRLGQHLLNGWVLERDTEQGLAWLDRAAKAGHAAAQAELGQVYLWGKLVPADPDRAEELLAAAADKGDVTAQRVLGEQLVGGWTLPRDVVRGQSLLAQAIAQGDAAAHVALGKLLMYGTGLDMDKAQALAHFEAAAEGGNGHGLAVYGEDLMWKFTAPEDAEAMLVRAGEMGASEAWVALAHGAMYGYLGGGSVSRAKFAGYAAKARGGRG